MSVMNVKSDPLLTFGITNASKFGACRMVVKSSNASPEDTSFMRTDISLIDLKLERGWERCFRREERAGPFSARETESSRS